MGKKCRHNHREIAFQVLYSLYFRNASSLSELQDLFLSCLDAARDQDRDVKDAKDAKEAKSAREAKHAGDAGEKSESPKPARPERRPEGFGWQLVRGVWENQDRLDRIIADFARRGLDRIGRTELVILRLGVYELLQPEPIDSRIILSEAIILAHDFGDENSYQFINGILHSIATAIAEKKLASL